VECLGKPLPIDVTPDTIVGDMMKIPGVEPIIEELAKKISIFQHDGNEAVNAGMQMAMMLETPLHALCSFAGENFTRQDMFQLVDRLNALQM